MKVKAVTVSLLLAVGSLFASLSAQERIQALFKKCETIESVDMNVVKNKNGRSIITISFKDNDALLKDFIEAFKAEESKANQVMTNRKGGKRSSHYSFDSVRYNVDFDDKGRVMIVQMTGKDEFPGFSYHTVSPGDVFMPLDTNFRFEAGNGDVSIPFDFQPFAPKSEEKNAPQLKPAQP